MTEEFNTTGETDSTVKSVMIKEKSGKSFKLEPKKISPILPKNFLSIESYDMFRPIISVINNYPHGFFSDRIPRVSQITEEHFPDIRVETMHFSELDYDTLEQSIGIILSGSSHNVSSFYHYKRLEQKYKPEMDFILKHPNIPTLGICYGFHLIGYAFNGTIHRMEIPSPGNQIIELELKRTDELIPYKRIAVNIFHRDYISPDDIDLQSQFEFMAIYQRGDYPTLQYMRHFHRPLYAVQFHPETHDPSYIYSNYQIEQIHSTRLFGEEVIKNFVILAKQQQLHRVRM